MKGKRNLPLAPDIYLFYGTEKGSNLFRRGIDVKRFPFQKFDIDRIEGGPI